MFDSEIFQFIFSDIIWPWVTATVESKTMEQRKPKEMYNAQLQQPNTLDTNQASNNNKELQILIHTEK